MTTRRGVLIVDDDDRVRYVLHRALLKLEDGCRVFTARNDREALEVIRQSEVDLVIADLGVKRMNGLRFTQALKRVDGDTMVIWITVDDCRDLRRAADRLAVHDCLEKPLEISEFRRAVREALAKIETPDASH